MPSRQKRTPSPPPHTALRSQRTASPPVCVAELAAPWAAICGGSLARHPSTPDAPKIRRNELSFMFPWSAATCHATTCGQSRRHGRRSCCLRKVRGKNKDFLGSKDRWGTLRTPACVLPVPLAGLQRLAASMHAPDRGDGGQGDGQMDRFSQTKLSQHTLSLTKARSWREEEGSPGSFPHQVVYCWKHGPQQINSPKPGLGWDTPPSGELGQGGG